MECSEKYYQQYKIDANEALELKMIRHAGDIEDPDVAFKPEMSHQVFGENEIIFGFKNLKIRLYYSACKLTTYVGITYDEKVDTKRCESVEADNVIMKLAEVLQPGFLVNVADFEKSLENDATFLPFGDKLDAFTVSEDGVTRNYETWTCDVDAPGFADYHERLQTFLLWYIDASSFIEIDDSRWHIFVLYEKYENKSTGKWQYAVLGYCTAYHYYSHPAAIRPRISQILILPPYQKKGLGTRFMDTIFKYYQNDSQVSDITVESPSENFQSIRDQIDVKNCAGLPQFSKAKLKMGLSAEMIKAAQEHFKIGKTQARRIYEILLLQHTDVRDEEDYRLFRLTVKRRLNVPYERRAKEFAKLRRFITDAQIQAAVGLVLSKQERIEQLAKQFSDVELQYRKVLDRIDSD